MFTLGHAWPIVCPIPGFADAHQGFHPFSSTRALVVMLFVARKEGYALGTLSLTHVFFEVLSSLQQAKQTLQIILHWILLLRF